MSLFNRSNVQNSTAASETPAPPTAPGDVDGRVHFALSDADWKQRLTREEFQVLRKGGTERPYVGEYTETREAGTYSCKACGAEIFTSNEKFASDCGWPAFYAPADNEAVVLIEDRSLGMARTEVRCARCDSHLGHVFRGEGLGTPTDERFCINSICLTHSPA